MIDAKPSRLGSGGACAEAIHSGWGKWIQGCCPEFRQWLFVRFPWPANQGLLEGVKWLKVGRETDVQNEWRCWGKTAGRGSCWV